MRRFKHIQEFLQNIGHKGGFIDGNNPVCNTGRSGRQGGGDILRPADSGKSEHDYTPFPRGRARVARGWARTPLSSGRLNPNDSVTS